MTTTTERLASFREAAGSAATLSKGACEALYHLAQEFVPDHILELGPTDGVATLVLLEAAAEIGASVSLVGSEVEAVWRDEIAPRASDVAAHPPLNVRFVEAADVTLPSQGRVLLWWGGPSPDDAELLLAQLPLALLGSDNVLAAPCLGADPDDARQYRTPTGERLLWAHGMLLSWGLVTLLDFLARNGVEPELRGGRLLAATVPTTPFAPASPPRRHNAAFESYRATRRGTPQWELDYLGVRTRTKFVTDAAAPDYVVRTSPMLPRFDEEYPEWIDVLDAVERASARFTMVELGAGWGRWLARGGTAARLRGLPCELVGVEAEPTHFAWLRTHLEDNGLADSSRLIEAAVAPADGWVRFHVGDPASWYGQAIDPNDPGFKPKQGCWRERRRVRATAVQERDVVRVPAVSLASVLAPLGQVDLIDADIQGSEADVFEAAPAVLAAKVKLVHVGTHSEENEERLRALFTRLGWRKRFDFACLGERETPWGRIEFQDGVQSWENPAFFPPAAASAPG